MQYTLGRPDIDAVTAEEIVKTLSFYDTTAEERDYNFIQHLKKEDIPQDCTYCGHCMPCPHGIKIPSANRYYDLAKAGDPLPIEHYRNLIVHADACISCGNCAGECPFHVDMPCRMKEISGYFE